MTKLVEHNHLKDELWQPVWAGSGHLQFGGSGKATFIELVPFTDQKLQFFKSVVHGHYLRISIFSD